MRVAAPKISRNASRNDREGTSVNSRALTQNTILNLAGQLIPGIIGLVSIPLLITHIGKDRFGLLSLVWTVISYFTLFDLGLDQALVKLVAEKIGDRAEEEIPGIFWNALLILTVMSVIGSMILFALTPFLVRSVFKIPDLLQDEAIRSFYCLSLSLILITLTASFRGVLEARQRFGFANLLYSLMGVSIFVGPLIVSFWTADLFALVFMLLLVRVFIFVAHAWFVFYLYPELRNPGRIEKNILRRLFRFAAWMTVSNIISPIMVYFDRFILAAIVPIGFLGFYTTPYEVVNRLLVIPGSVVRTIFPTFAFLGVEKSRGVEVIFVRCVKLILFVMFPTILLLVYFGGEGLNLWLGAEFAEKSYRVLQVLSIGILLNGIAFIPSTLLQSAERPDLGAKIHLLEFPFYLPAVWLMANHFGLLGAAIAFTVRVGIDMFLLFGAVCWVVPNITRELLRLFWPLVMLLLFFIPPFFTLTLSLRLILATAILFTFAFVFWMIVLRLEDRLMVLRQIRLEAKRKSHYRLSPVDHHSLTPDVGGEKPRTRVWAVVSIFNPTRDVLKNIRSYLDQVEMVVVVDNGSASEVNDLIEDLANEKLILIRNNVNVGFAAAFNTGIQMAASRGAEWVVTFRQESRVEPGYIDCLIDSYLSHPEPDRVALITPRPTERKQVTNSPWAEGRTTVTSGAMIKLSAVHEVGLFEERFIYSYIDHEFALRLMSHGHRVIESTRAKCLDHVGEQRLHGAAGLSFSATHHSPIRHYYRARNRLVIYRRFMLIEPAWILSDLRTFISDLFKVGFIEDEKLRKFISIARGLFHGLKFRGTEADVPGLDRPLLAVQSRVGIVLATYQPPLRFFREQLESIRAQTDPNWFVIINDDNSADSYREAIQKMAQDILTPGLDGRSRFTFQQNLGLKGVVGNFADGLTKLPGDCSHVCFCDQDDLWVPTKLAIMKAQLMEDGVSLVHSDLRLIDDIGREIHPSCWSFEGRDVARTDSASLILRNTVSGCAMMFRREVLNFCLPFPEQPPGRPFFYHDVWIALGAGMYGEIRAIPLPLISYRQHGNNVVGAEQGILGSWHQPQSKKSSAQWSVQKIEAAWRSRSKLEECYLDRVASRTSSGLDVDPLLLSNQLHSPSRVFSVPWDFGTFAFLLAARVAMRSPRYIKVAVLIALGKLFSDVGRLASRLGLRSIETGQAP